MRAVEALLMRLLGRWRVLVLFGLFLLTALLAIPAAHVGIEQDNRSMVADDAARLADYDRFLKLFGNDEQLLLSVGHTRLLEKSGRELLSSLAERVAGLDGVTRVWSLANAQHLVPGRWGAEPHPLFNDSADAAALQAILDDNPQFKGLLISADLHTAVLLIELEDRRHDHDYRRLLIESLRALQQEYAGHTELHLTGVGVQKNDVARFIDRDQRVVLPLVVAMLALLLVLIFRHPSGLLLPLAVTAISLVWTMGCYGLAGLELNTITALLPPVIMVLSVSTSVHLYNGWLQLQGDDAQRLPLLAGKVGELFTPCLFTSLTTALGLASLTISSVPAVRHFGLFAALGVSLAFVVGMLLVPVWLSFQRLIVDVRRREGLGFLKRILEWIARLTLRYPQGIIVVTLLLLTVSAVFIPTIRNNTNLVAFLKKDTPLAIDTRSIDRQLGSVNTLEFMFERRDGKPLTELADYRTLEALVKQIEQQPQVAGALSILTLLRPLQRAESGGEKLALPDNQDELDVLLELLAMSNDPQLSNRFLTPERTVARFSVRLPILGSQQTATLAQQILGMAAGLGGGRYQLTATGSFYQVAVDSNNLVVDMLRSFSLSLLLVMLSILVLLRSLRLTLLSMIPNLIPIIWAAGVMGAAGIDLSTGTAMIGAVVIGLAVDDTIHYLVNYRRVFRGEPRGAVFATTTGTGRALTVSSLVLALGFWVGCFGSFWPTIYFSLLVGGTLIAALLCDLVVLPAVLVLGSPQGEEVPE
ncbi:MAG: hypothetical protein C0624_11215 [Desulfuromonas sp.]|nr:MAG: hypothetical protein C0624_11215 [Desulfuromonas sp.]